jgi:hypothetical protein
VNANFGDFQNGVYAQAVQGITTRYPFDFASIERKASEALPDWVYRYVSAAAGDGRTQRANIAAFSCYGFVPRMMVSPPERDLSIQLFDKHLISPMFLAPIGLVGLCAPDFHGDVAAAQASAATGVPYTLSTFTQTRMGVSRFVKCPKCLRRANIAAPVVQRDITRPAALLVRTSTLASLCPTIQLCGQSISCAESWE